MVSHLSLLCRGELGRKWNPFGFSWNLEKLGHVVQIHKDRAIIDSGVEGVVPVVLSKHVRVKNSDLLILDGTFEIEEWELPTSTHLLIYLNGAKHL